MKKLILSLAFLSAFTLRGSAQLQGLEVVKVPEAQQPYSGEYIYIPDVEGYKTLKCDFHTHTIFSDGDIKPENRVWEAAIRGLDVIAITDHIEYRPNKDYIKADHNDVLFLLVVSPFVFSDERTLKAALAAWLIFAMFSYPVNVVPLMMNFVLFIGLCRGKTVSVLDINRIFCGIAVVPLMGLLSVCGHVMLFLM